MERFGRLGAYPTVGAMPERGAGYTGFMKKAFTFLAALALFILPAFALAEGIVPDDIATGGPYLQACDLVRVFDNLLRFAVYFATAIATLMFAYAGFLYVTASASQSNLENARKIFGNVFIGLVFILGAWLIINLVMNVFYDQDRIKYPWNEIQCEGYGDVTVFVDGPPPIDSSLPGSPGGFGQIPADDLLSHQDALKALQAAGVVVDSTSGPGGVQAGCTGAGCTSLLGIQERTVENTVALKKGCPDCEIVVTGATERGVHAAKGGHEQGYKVDLDDTPSLNNFIEKSEKFTRSGTQNGYPVYKDVCGNTYVKEGDHWDVLVIRKCSF